MTLEAYFQYWFNHTVRNTEMIGGTAVVVETVKEVVFYSNWEKEARQQFLDTYGYEAGDLLRREPY